MSVFVEFNIGQRK